MSDILENYEHYLSVLEEIGEQPELTEEEFAALSEEELAEVSKEKLKRYISKAQDSRYDTWNWERGPSDSRAPWRGKTKEERRKNRTTDLKREKGMSLASDKIHGGAKVRATEETEEQIDELSRGTVTSYVKKVASSKGADSNDIGKRVNGLKMATKKLKSMKEEEESLPKLSKDEIIDRLKPSSNSGRKEKVDGVEDRLPKLSKDEIIDRLKPSSNSGRNSSSTYNSSINDIIKGKRMNEEDDTLDEMKKPHKPKLNYKLDAEYSGGKKPINKGYHKSLGAARKHVDSLDNPNRERWPIGHDPVITDRKTGKKYVYTDKIEPMDESTVAADSLATHPIGKADAMAHLLGHMNSMSKGAAIDFFQKVMAQFGPGKEFGVSDHSGQNQATIDSKLGAGPKTADAMPHLNVKEDIEEMFNGQDLSEEFKANVATLFEAAVSARVIAEQAVLEEAYEDALAEEVANINEELTSKLNTYLDHVVGHWMEENEVAIESTLRNELAGEFIEGLKNLFAEHYIDVPEDKVEAIEALADKVSVLEGRLDETISENVELKNAILEAHATEIFEELASDLALTQRDKFSALAEGVEFDGDLDTYAKKLMIVKENYFGYENTSYSSNIEEETFEGELSESVNVDPQVNRYVQALTRTVKNK